MESKPELRRGRSVSRLEPNLQNCLQPSCNPARAISETTAEVVAGHPATTETERV